MVTKSFEIANEVVLHYIKTDKFKTNYMSFNFVAPLNRDDAHYNAMLPLILMRGTEKYPSQAHINKRLQYLYSADISARNDSFGEYQIFGMRANMLNNRYANGTDVTRETVDLLLDMVFNPYLVNGEFDKDFTKGEKINLIDVIEAEKNNKGGYALTRLTEEMCKDEVFGISKMGEVDKIKKITSKSLYKAYKDAIKNYKIQIYFVGDCDIDSVADQIKARFVGIERTPVQINDAPIIEKATEVKEIVETEKVNQGKLVMGMRTGAVMGSKQHAAAIVLNEIFGASPISKLFMNVREKMGLCYYCSSAYNTYSGVLLVSSGIDGTKREIATEAILGQLEDIKNGKISDAEFDSAKKSLINAYRQSYDNPFDIFSFYSSRMRLGIDESIDECISALSRVNMEDVIDVARSVIHDTTFFLEGIGAGDGEEEYDEEL
jgi:predicted Zn-dependent peptidase